MSGLVGPMGLDFSATGWCAQTSVGIPVAPHGAESSDSDPFFSKKKFHLNLELIPTPKKPPKSVWDGLCQARLGATVLRDYVPT
jgi:hypothetical protein